MVFLSSIPSLHPHTVPENGMELNSFHLMLPPFLHAHRYPDFFSKLSFLFIIGFHWSSQIVTYNTVIPILGDFSSGNKVILKYPCNQIISIFSPCPASFCFFLLSFFQLQNIIRFESISLLTSICSPSNESNKNYIANHLCLIIFH